MSKKKYVSPTQKRAARALRKLVRGLKTATVSPSPDRIELSRRKKKT